VNYARPALIARLVFLAIGLALLLWYVFHH
jgi:hypothetical protein